MPNDNGLNGPTYFPKTGNGYFDKSLNRFFNNKDEKRTFMRENKIINEGSLESERQRRSRIENMVNADREKRKQKPMTLKQIYGDRY